MTFKTSSMLITCFFPYNIGDETFIIAALMAMCHPKAIVLSGALTTLIVMTISKTITLALYISSFSFGIQCS